MLCVGLDSLWRLFQEGDEAGIETSSWMITNESPDGYAVMHVSGKTGWMSVGDVTAMRTESGENWKSASFAGPCQKIRSILSSVCRLWRRCCASLPGTAHRSQQRCSPVGSHPARNPGSACDETLVVPSGALENNPGKLILVVEKENIEIREMKSIHLDEQNSQIEVF